MLDSLIAARNASQRLGHDQALNLNYRFQADSTVKSLSLDLDYFTYDRNISAQFKSQNWGADVQRPPVSSEGNTHSHQKIKNHSARIDVEYPTKAVILAYGAKVSFTRSDNANAFFDLGSGKPILDSAKSSQFQYRENTQALYLSASKKLDAHWQGKLGIRV